MDDDEQKLGGPAEEFLELLRREANCVNTYFTPEDKLQLQDVHYPDTWIQILSRSSSGAPSALPMVREPATLGFATDLSFKSDFHGDGLCRRQRWMAGCSKVHA